MSFREPSAHEIRAVLLEGARRPRTGLSTLAPGETMRGHLRRVYGSGATLLDFPERREIARRLYLGGISTGAIASILRMDSKKSTIDSWVLDCYPDATVGLDGKIRKVKRPEKTEPPEPPKGDEILSPIDRDPSPRNVMTALIKLRRADVPIDQRKKALRRHFGLPVQSTFYERRELARELRRAGFTASVVRPIVGVSYSQIYKWSTDVESGLRYGIRGTELGDGTGLEAENIF